MSTNSTHLDRNGAYEFGDHGFESLGDLERILIGREPEAKKVDAELDMDFAKAGSEFVRMFRQLAEDSLTLSGYRVVARGPSTELPGKVSYAYRHREDDGGTMRYVSASIPIEIEGTGIVEAIIEYEAGLRPSRADPSNEHVPISDTVAFEPLRIVGRNGKSYSVYERRRSEIPLE